MINNACHLRSCSCSNGAGSTGTNCPSDGAAFCASCTAGFIRENGVCRLPVSGERVDIGCYLDLKNGVRDITGHYAVIPDNQPEGSVAFCIDTCMELGFSVAALQYTFQCFCGFSFGSFGSRPSSECNMACRDDTDDTCGAGSRNQVYGSLRVCTCANGQAAFGNDCPAHDQEFCSSCNEGANMVDNVCGVNTCICENGVGATGTDCPEHGEELCISCHDLVHPHTVLFNGSWTAGGSGQGCSVENISRRTNA